MFSSSIMHKGDESRKDCALKSRFVSDTEEGQSLVPKPEARHCRQLLMMLLPATQVRHRSSYCRSLLGGFVPVEYSKREE